MLKRRLRTRWQADGKYWATPKRNSVVIYRKQSGWDENGQVPQSLRFAVIGVLHKYGESGGASMSELELADSGAIIYSPLPFAEGPCLPCLTGDVLEDDGLGLQFQRMGLTHPTVLYKDLPSI